MRGDLGRGRSGGSGENSAGRPGDSEEPELLAFAVEGGGIDAERAGRLLEVAGDGENPANMFSLERIDRNPGTDRDARFGFRPEFLRQVAELDGVLRREDDGALDHIAQLAQVSGPPVAPKGRQNVGGKARNP